MTKIIHNDYSGQIDNIEEYINNGYSEILADHNIQIIFCKEEEICFCIDNFKAQVFMFTGPRALYQAKRFNEDNGIENLKEGLSYDVLICRNSYELLLNTKSFLNTEDGLFYSIMSYSRGFLVRSAVKTDIKNFNDKFELLNKVCIAIKNHDLSISVSSTNNDGFVIYNSKLDTYSYKILELNDKILYSNNFNMDETFRGALKNREYTSEKCYIGLIVFDNIDMDYSKELKTKNSRGAVLYYASTDEYVIFKYFKYKGYQSILDNVFKILMSNMLPYELITDNDMLYDVLKYNLSDITDFTLDKNNKINHYLSCALSSIQYNGAEYMYLEEHLNMLGQLFSMVYHHLDNVSIEQITEQFKFREELEDEEDIDDELEEFLDEEFMDAETEDEFLDIEEKEEYIS